MGACFQQTLETECRVYARADSAAVGAQTYTAPPPPSGTVVAPQAENSGGGGGVSPGDRWKIIVGVVVGVVAALLLVFGAWCCVRSPQTRGGRFQC